MGHRAAAVVSRRVLLRVEPDGARVLSEFGSAVQVRYRGDKGEFVFVGEVADKKLGGRRGFVKPLKAVSVCSYDIICARCRGRDFRDNV